ncbi:MAG: DMT family transporter [Hyphomicrobiales bacterium]
MTSHVSSHDALRAGLTMVLASASFVVNDTLVKLLGGTVPAGEIIAVRGGMSVLLLGIVCFQQRLFFAVRHLLAGSVVARAGFDCVATFLFIVALLHMPIASLTSIIQTVPLAVIGMAYLLLGERVGWRRMTAIVVGFIGVLFIARPSPASFSLYDGFAVLIVLLAAARDIITRRIPGYIPVLIVAFGNAILVALGGLAFGLVEGFVPLAPWQFACLAAASLFLGLGYSFMVMTLRLGEIAVSAPFRYANVLFSIFSGVAVFGEYPDLLALCGMALIVVSGLYTIHRQRVLANKLAATH